MPNAREAEANKQRSILTIADIGSGKTTQFLTLPGKKFMYIFDPNALDSLRGYDVDYEEFRVNAMDLDLSIKTLKKDVGDRPYSRKKAEPKTYRAWEEDFEKKMESGFFNEYDWVGMDSLTTFSDIVMDRVQYLAGRLGKHPEQADYTAQMNSIRNVFRGLMGVGCNIYATAHHDLKQDDLSNRIYNQLLLTGKLRTQIPLLFTEVLVLHSTVNKGEVSYMMQTVRDRENPKVRSTFKGLNPFEDITIDWKKDPVGQGLAAFL